jgi:hypothetical protein
MLQFTYKLKLTERVKAKCSRHPRYNPVKDGRAGVRGGCSTCFSLYDLHQARIALDAAQREFVRRPVRGRGNANPARGKPPTQPRNLPCMLRTEIERLRVQPLCFLRTRIVGNDAVESGHAALRTGRGRGCYETRQSRWGLQTRCTHLNQRHGFTGAWFPFRLTWPQSHSELCSFLITEMPYLDCRQSVRIALGASRIGASREVTALSPQPMGDEQRSTFCELLGVRRVDGVQPALTSFGGSADRRWSRRRLAPNGQRPLL